MKLTIFCTYSGLFFIMSGKYVIAATVATFGFAWVCDHYVSDKKLFGGKLWISVGIDLCYVVLWLYQLYVTSNSFFRFCVCHCFKREVVWRDRQEVSGVASHCWSTSCDESYYSPEFHCEVSWVLNLVVHWFWINWFAFVMKYGAINDRYCWDETLAV